MAKYIINRDTQYNYYWILKSTNNGKTICKSSESYESKQGARESIEWTKANAQNAIIEDLA